MPVIARFSLACGLGLIVPRIAFPFSLMWFYEDLGCHLDWGFVGSAFFGLLRFSLPLGSVDIILEAFRVPGW